MPFTIMATNRNHLIVLEEPDLTRVGLAYLAGCRSLEQGSSNSSAERSIVDLP